MDIKIKNENKEFYARACGLINQDGKFLVMKIDDAPYYHIPGGHIEIGEESATAIKREIKEEIGCDITVKRLFAVEENFWTLNGKKYHGIEFFYLVEPTSKLPLLDYKKCENDKGIKKMLEFKWISLNELKDIDLRPNNIKEVILKEKYINDLVHIVKK